MSYPVLKAGQPDQSRSGLCALAIMAKAPRPGKVKTRLAPPLTLDQSAALNICFLKDTTQNIDSIEAAAGLVCYTPVGDESLFDTLLPSSFALIPQREGTFGERLLAAAQDILSTGFGSVCLIDSDSPTVPAAAFAQAAEALAQPGDRIVLGPSDDGGYYLIGLKQAHPEPFQNITWSTSVVCAETIERIAAAGIELVLLPTWYDVDDGATLAVLRAELLEATPPPFTTLPGYAAPHTHTFLEDMEQAR